MGKIALNEWPLSGVRTASLHVWVWAEPAALPYRDDDPVAVTHDPNRGHQNWTFVYLPNSGSSTATHRERSSFASDATGSGGNPCHPTGSEPPLRNDEIGHPAPPRSHAVGHHKISAR